MSTLGLQWLSIFLKIKTKILIITTFKTVQTSLDSLCTNSSLLSSLQPNGSAFSLFSLCFPIQGFAYAGLPAQNHIPSCFHLVNIYPSDLCLIITFSGKLSLTSLYQVKFPLLYDIFYLSFVVLITAAILYFLYKSVHI